MPTQSPVATGSQPGIGSPWATRSSFASAHLPAPRRLPASSGGPGSLSFPLSLWRRSIGWGDLIAVAGPPEDLDPSAGGDPLAGGSPLTDGRSRQVALMWRPRRAPPSEKTKRRCLPLQAQRRSVGLHTKLRGWTPGETRCDSRTLFFGVAGLSLRGWRLLLRRIEPYGFPSQRKHI